MTDTAAVLPNGHPVSLVRFANLAERYTQHFESGSLCTGSLHADILAHLGLWRYGLLVACFEVEVEADVEVATGTTAVLGLGHKH